MTPTRVRGPSAACRGLITPQASVTYMNCRRLVSRQRVKMAKAITSLNGVATGCYVLITEGATRYLVDLDFKTITRRSEDPNQQWDFVGIGINEITKDNELLQYDSISGLAVGEQIEVESADEWRLTAPVVAIRKHAD